MPAENSKTAARSRILQTVSQHMARLDVAGLPRNYELFHEAMSGSDAGLSRDVSALTASPSQTILDEIGLRYQLPGFIGLAATGSHAKDAALLAELAEKVSRGVSHKQTFGRALETVARSLRHENASGISDILAEIEYLTASLSDAVIADQELAASLKDGAERLSIAEQEASVARGIALRDRLTSLPNHAALAERLETLYGPTADTSGKALVLVSIRDLGDLQQAYGEAVTNRIIKKAAAVFRKTIKKHDFVARVGAGDFAFLFDDVTRDKIAPIADRLIGSIADNLVFAASDRGPSAVLQLAIGAALKDEAFSPQQLRLQAAAALDSAKANPRLPVAIHGEALKRAS